MCTNYIYIFAYNIDENFNKMNYSLSQRSRTSRRRFIFSQFILFDNNVKQYFRIQFSGTVIMLWIQNGLAEYCVPPIHTRTSYGYGQIYIKIYRKQQNRSIKNFFFFITYLHFHTFP